MAFGSAFRAIAGKLVELDPPTPEQQKTPVATTAAKPSGNTATAVQSANYDATMLEALQKQVMARTSPYTTLIESSAKLEAVIPDEVTRLKAAYTMIASDGQRSVSSISQAIDVHITDLEGARMRFKQTSDQQMKAKSGSLREQATRLEQMNQQNDKTIENLQAQIQRLTEDTQKNCVSIAELTTQATQAEAEIIATAEAFERTVDYLKADLQSKKSSLASVLA